MATFSLVPSIPRRRRKASWIYYTGGTPLPAITPPPNIISYYRRQIIEYTYWVRLRCVLF